MAKLFVFLSSFLLLLSCGRGNNSGSGNMASADSLSAPYMYFKEESHNLGKVTEGEKVSYTFVVENKGKTDLLIKNVETSCGCTVANFEKKPIPSGKTGNIELVLNTSGKVGRVTKTARVTSNAKPDNKTLTIGCEILPK
jgi:hypothetical protein